MRPVAIAAVFVAGALSAHAEGLRGFGDAGEVVPSGGLALVSNSFQTVLSIQPMVEYFVVPNLALGLGLSYAHASSQGGSTFNSYGASISIGYNVRLAEAISIFPRISFAGAHSVASSGAPSIVGGGSSGAIGLTGFLPLLLHPVSHFFLGIGPQISTAGPSSDLFRNQTFAITTIIGGWI